MWQVSPIDDILGFGERNKVCVIGLSREYCWIDGRGIHATRPVKL